MGCFPACFGHWKHKEAMKIVQDQCVSPCHESAKLLPATTESFKEEEIENTLMLVSESEYKSENQSNKSSREEAASDHSNIKKGTNELTSSNCGGDKLVLDNENGDMVKDKDDGFESKSSNSVNHETHDFLINDKDSVAVKSNEMTLQHCRVQEESSESLFSLSIDSRRQFFAVEMGDKEVTSPFKMIKSSTPLKFDKNKENVPLSKDPITKQSFDDELKLTNDDDDHQFKKRDSELAVETSLSSWLVESEKSPKETSIGNSPESEKNYEEREILGGSITCHAEFKELNEFSSGGSTPCRSSDEQLGIGTVGRYWRQRSRAG